MAFPFSSRSLAWGGPEAEGRKKLLLPVGWLKMNRKRINELREQARATVFFFETAPVFFPVLHSCWSITLPQLTPGRRIGCRFARRTDELPGKIPLFFRFCFPAASDGVNKTLDPPAGKLYPEILIQPEVDYSRGGRYYLYRKNHCGTQGRSFLISNRMRAAKWCVLRKR